jgi:hypothetical protein
MRKKRIFRKALKVVEEVSKTVDTDILGMYNANPVDIFEEPTQDADDL